MKNVTRRVQGAAEELGGKIEKAVGKVIGNEQLKADGRVAELHGKAEQEAAKTAERLKGKVEEVVGAVKSHVGGAIDSEQMQAEGKAKELKGAARQKANQ